MERNGKMTQDQKEHIGKKLKALRQEFGLSQNDWARLLQVSQNTVARWERGELEPKGAHRKKAEQMLTIGKDAKAVNTIKSTLNSEGGLPAVAAFVGMLFGAMGVLGASLSLLSPLLKSKSSLLDGIKQYTEDKEQNEEKGPGHQV